MLKTLITAFALLCLFSPAEAKSRHSGLHKDCNITMPCVAPYASTPAKARATRGAYVASEVGIGGPIKKRHVRKHRRVLDGIAHGSMTEAARPIHRVAQIVSHPSGCPSRSFCGCGAAVRVFGKPIRDLWLAANWLRKFPRAEPARGMVAARRGHVFVLEEHLGGSIWLAYDANSGRHQTRIHPRSIAGFTIVNPRAG